MAMTNEEIIKCISAIKVQKGEWKRYDEWRNGEYIGGFYHVNCPCEEGYFSSWRTNFCGNCGCEMSIPDI